MLASLSSLAQLFWARGQLGEPTRGMRQSAVCLKGYAQEEDEQHQNIGLKKRHSNNIFTRQNENMQLVSLADCGVLSPNK